MGKPIIWSGTNAKLINSGDLVDKNDLSLTNGAKVNYTWVGHGLTSADIGRPVRVVSANQLALAQADTAANAEVLGFVYAILDVDTLRIALGGECRNPGANSVVGGSFGANIVYFLDDSTTGKLTAAEPTNVGSISKPIAIGTSLSSFIFINYRGNTVGSTNARTQISLSNNSTTNMQNCASYDAGSIEGWIYIDGTTDYRFYFNAPFSKYGAGGNYYISPSYVGDTPPAGFSITINSSGQSIVTMPSITGFVSATCTYSLNAPAVGTNFPLSVSANSVLGNSGITPTANNIGYVVSSTISSTTPTTSEGDVTGASLTLTPGTWRISWSLVALLSTGSAVGNTSYFYVVLTDSSNNRIPKTARILGGVNPSSSVFSIYGTIAASIDLNVTSTTTYKLRTKRQDNSGTGSGSLAVDTGSPANYECNFYATLIA